MIKSNVLLLLLFLCNASIAQDTARSAGAPRPAGNTPGPHAPGTTATTTAPQSLTLSQCYTLAEANYPLTRQRALIQKTTEYSIENISKGIYPQFAINGSATYQSDVTKITIPPAAGINLNIPTVSKDQYKLYGEVSQTLTDFGINKQRQAISRTTGELQEQNLDAQLYQLKDRINQLFFGIILIDGQLRQNKLAEKDVQTGINNTRAAIANGTAYISSLNKLKAELLKTNQHAIELRASRKAYTDMLSLFINEPVDTTTTIIRPATPALTDSIRRPELKAYDLQLQSYAQQSRLTRLNTYPQLNAFFQGGMGKPNPVNFLSTQLSSYYLTGIRLTWNFGNSYTSRKEQLINRNNQEMTRAEKNTFLFNTEQTLKQQKADIEKFQQLIANDNEIVDLRESVSKTSAVQLQNGALTANDYLLDINAAAQARQDRLVHEIQLLLSQYNHLTTSGNQ